MPQKKKYYLDKIKEIKCEINFFVFFLKVFF